MLYLDDGSVIPTAAIIEVSILMMALWFNRHYRIPVHIETISKEIIPKSREIPGLPLGATNF